MKNKFRFFLMSVLACFCLASVVSCSDDDDDPVVPQPQPEKAVEFTYSYSCSDDLFEVADINITYVNEEKKAVTETLSAKEWKKAMKVKSPFAANMKVTYSLKKDVTLNKEKYRMEYMCTIPERMVVNTNAMTIGADKVADYLKRTHQEIGFDF